MQLNWFMAAVVAGLATAAPANVSVKAGIEAWQRGDHAAAAAIWRNLAEKGDADAAFNLGQAYRLGRGVPADSGQAKQWFERAAGKGHLDAQVSLGLLLFDSGDRAAAMGWLNRAAERGEPRALLVVGTAMFNGDGMSQDPILGYAYVSRAAAQGLAPAKTTLAEMDKIMTVEERRKGVAIALSLVKGSPPAGSKPAAKTPKAKPSAARTVAAATAAPKAQIVAKGAWRVQLGAFGQRKSAVTLYGKLSGKLAGRQAYYIPVGAMTRLQVGPFESRAAAAAACAKLAPQPCFPVEAR